MSSRDLLLGDSNAGKSGMEGEEEGEREDLTLTFLRRTFREYYFRHHDSVEIPPRMANREFGYTPFGRGMVRHLSYSSEGELAADLVKQAPSSVYCSNGVYENPNLPMDDKGWTGAYLIFDIDASSMPTPCQAKHTFWVCNTCGRNTKTTARPASCSKCHGTEIAQLHWSCSICLQATKEHVLRLLDFLTNDFGVSDRDINVYFSGNRGYHLHVFDRRFEKLEPPARAEMAGYVRGAGLQAARRPSQRTVIRTPAEAYGWSRRVAASKGQPPQKPEQVVGSHASLIDEGVTTDIHRIFRMPGTLHGSSGLSKMRVHNLRSFRPEQDPVVLGEEKVPVHVKFSPEFQMKGARFGPYTDEKVSLPTFAAVYLLIKGLGTVAG